MRVLPLLGLLVSPLALAEALSPEVLAKMKDEQRTAIEKINKEYGNKPSSELSQDQRREIIEKTAAAQQAVLDKHGVSGKDFARYEAKLSLDDRKREAEAAKKIQDAKQKEREKHQASAN
jgi:hypothetical protein